MGYKREKFLPHNSEINLGRNPTPFLFPMGKSGAIPTYIKPPAIGMNTLHLDSSISDATSGHQIEHLVKTFKQMMCEVKPR